MSDFEAGVLRATAAALPWFFEDAAFDSAHADEAVAALQRANWVLIELAGEQRTMVGDACEAWAGRYRDEFDEEEAISFRHITDAIDQVTATIGQIRSAQAGAEYGQAVRRQRRADHEEEQAMLVRREQYQITEGFG